MAEAVKLENRRTSTYGSLAYDLSSVATAPREIPLEVPQSPEREQTGTRTREQARPTVRTRTRKKALERPGVSPLAVIGTIAVLVVLVLLLLSYVQMTMISSETVGLNEQIAQLEEENTQLSIQYESTFDLTEIERYAVAELGMVKANNAQIHQLNSQEEDHAVILGEAATEEESLSIFDRIELFFYSIVEFFRS